MENKDKKIFDSIFRNINNGVLGQALHDTRALVDTYPHLMYNEELENIERDYVLMLDYMKRGFNDPQRNEIYNNLITRLYRFASDFHITYKTRQESFFTDISRKAANTQLTNNTIKDKLEGFVADVAMLSLESENTRAEKSKEIHRRHYDFMQSLFCQIVVSRQWSEHDCDFYKEMLLSPTIDANDAQLILSALTLAAMNNMDIYKFSVLIHTYKHSTDEKTRQKALVGWVFSLSSSIYVCKNMKQMIAEVLADDNVVNEIADLQKQMVFCMNAEQDTDTIRRDIMPDLIKHNNINITRFGITEKEEDPTADIFDPGVSDRAMEKMEESVQKMMNMQKAGSDIYFGGFSQMKRFPFFYNMVNWFCPFYIEHPDISRTTGRLENTPLLLNILDNGPFCDSDKYSFTLAISSIINHLPPNIKEMLNSQEALGPIMSEEDKKSPTYIRRMILQDMYRFFRLYPQHSQLVNPFDAEHSTFVTDSMLCDTNIRELMPDMCFFMIKHRNKAALEKIIEKYDDGNNTKMLLAHGIYELNFAKNPQKAISILEELKSIEPLNKRATSLLARSYFENRDYESAADCYKTIYDLDPDNKNAALNYCIALAKAKKYDEAVNPLYKMDIETPDSSPVIRVLAWTLMGLGKYEQAEKEYNRLQKLDNMENGDWLNAGYCQWLKGNVAEAVALFKKFIKSQHTTDNHKFNIAEEFYNDKDFLVEHGLNQIDILLMTDLLTL